MEKKQSSIDWLEHKLMIWEKNYEKWVEIPTRELKDLVKQAKAMHKEESELLFECGRNFQLTGEGTFNQVYNERFGGDNETH